MLALLLHIVRLWLVPPVYLGWLYRVWTEPDLPGNEAVGFGNGNARADDAHGSRVPRRSHACNALQLSAAPCVPDGWQGKSQRRGQQGGICFRRRMMPLRDGEGAGI